MGSDEKTDLKAKFIELEYGIETGEAERIAVDGVSRGVMEGGVEDNPSESTWKDTILTRFRVVGNLRTQRNAIRMLRDRIGVLLEYVTALVNSECRGEGEELSRRKCPDKPRCPSSDFSSHRDAAYHGCKGISRGAHDRMASNVNAIIGLT